MSIAVATSVGALRRRLASRIEAAFRAARREGTPGLDARILLAHALGVDADQLPLHDGEPVAATEEARAEALVERRIEGEPVARIVGRQEFWGLDLEIGPDTLLPRPDTETLVEAALALVDRRGRRDDDLSILDLGTGSGAILLAFLSEMPTATGLATDLSPAAIAIAFRNARRLGLSGRARFVVGDWAKALRGQFDLVLANPPYIESEAIAALQIEVRNHEPRLALDGGRDGLSAYRAILSDLDRVLARQGRAFFEIGHGQARKMTELAGEYGFSAAIHRDLASLDRVAELGRAADG